MLPDRRTVLVDLGRVWQAMGRTDDASAALLAASRGGEPRAAEMARELLPARYPFVSEFRQALALDPANHELRRELGYLLLRMGRESEAEAEFQIVTQNAPDDLLSATQLGFLLYARGEQIAAQPLFDRVLAGTDDDLANRVRAVLRLPQVLRPRASTRAQSIDAKIMAERSIKAGYMKDALKYLKTAHEEDSADFDVMLQTRLDQQHPAPRRDGLSLVRAGAPQSRPHASPPTPEGPSAASAPRPGASASPAWIFPLFSSRWHDLFAYGQVKTAINLGLPVHPYISLRFVGDTRRTVGSANPAIAVRELLHRGGGRRHPPVARSHRLGRGRYVDRLPPRPHAARLPRRRRPRPARLRREGSRAGSPTPRSTRSTSAASTTIFWSTRSLAPGTFGPLQLHWNGNLTGDAKRQDWANFVETGPGVQVPIAQSMYLTFNLLRGAYLISTTLAPHHLQRRARRILVCLHPLTPP